MISIEALMKNKIKQRVNQITKKKKKTYEAFPDVNLSMQSSPLERELL